MFGGQNQYLRKGEYQLGVAYRAFRSDKHYQGTRPFPELDPNGPINRQNQVNLDLTYALTSRWNVAVNVPLQVSSFSVRRPVPGTPDRIWVRTRSNGLGDASLRGRYWLLSPLQSKHNIGVTLGLKFPTGRAGRTDDVFGRQVPVDVSVQPGDKAWGWTLGAQAFRDLGTWSVYGTAVYLCNARDTTGVPTFFGSLTNPGNTVVNSSSDQYLVQFGAALKTASKWPTPTMGYRISGVPVADLFGPSNGFRRPGVFGFFEPGLSLGFGKHLLAFTMPIANYINVKDSPTSGRIEDATIPRYSFTVAYSLPPGQAEAVIRYPGASKGRIVLTRHP